MMIKDLSILGRDLANIILVDNLRESSLLQPSNLLLCTPFYQDKLDREFQFLLPFLQYLATKTVCDEFDVLIIPSHV